MKVDPSIPYLGSLLALVLCTAGAVAALLFARLHPLLHAGWFQALAVVSLLVLLVSYRALGRPLTEEEAAAYGKR
ncbi:hypothetical protein [Stenotrophomonas sp. MMGLT7]|uniref:hypothetical protein n=1 Tax=Stenotrophomonas sp. MMGLT7 TaxID=2901227 RepID=UPI001E31CAF7|nr:hypothetical protein [Stenotrophomonas sp. MMGLT7]MCD7099019.1 hypothetical protein [Stenotrophomonas sp. MMGLT7]